MIDKPERSEVLYTIAVLSMHTTHLEGQTATATAENAALLRKRAAQTDRVINWLNAMSLGDELP